MASILSPLFAPQFVATRSAEELAKRLREDESLINNGKPCSHVAWHLSGYDTEKGRTIAAYLAPLPGLTHDIKSIIYENLLKKIRRSQYGQKQAQESWDLSKIATVLEVLVQLQKTSVIQQDTPAEAIIAWLTERLTSQAPPEPPLQDDIFSATSSRIPKPPRILCKRLCYICRLVNTQPHPSQPSMCTPCGTFNLSSSLISTPPQLLLPNFTALVTGSRINLGYHTALRLLRCGARVIATTRYPRDAVARYLGESDSAEWRHRLRVVGADFRCAADAFALVENTKRCLGEWAGGRELKLDILINNAAQTLTDSVRKEKRAVDRERILARESNNEPLLIQGTYTARVRGEVPPMMLEGTGKNALDNSPRARTIEDLEPSNEALPAELESYSKSSWVQSIFDIPYEDVISAHAVNTFVPLILCRELLPLMGSEDNLVVSSKPRGYIINVSSREGIFEDRFDSSAKRGKHVHTNMSKAALNMITETEAAAAWKSRQVAMNTVDPGYMSAAPEFEDAYGGVRPIGWEDGAGRVLWPIAVGEIDGIAIKGRFLKHYGAVRIDPGLGRG